MCDETVRTTDEELDKDKELSEVKPYYRRISDVTNVFFQDERGITLTLDQVVERML